MAKWPSSRRYLGQEEHPRALHQLYSKRLREKNITAQKEL
jgi:hypothetical protein